MVRNYLIFAVIGILVVFVAATTTTVLSDQMADANVRKKIHFTHTVQSEPDPARGQGNHHTAFVLSPNEDTLYDGTINFASSKPVKVMVLHQIPKRDANGQPIWTVNGETMYAFTKIEPAKKGGTVEFTGSAVALRSEQLEPFTATVSVDGWIRGQPTPVISKFETKEVEPTLRLPRTQKEVTLSLNKGFHNENELFYIITDTNSKEYSNLISKNKEIDVNLSKMFSELPPSSLSKVYVFANGADGDGIYGHQHEVFTDTPEKTDEYSALRKVVEIKWKPGQNPDLLNSVEKIRQAKEKGRIQITETDTILNVPQIAWDQGKLQQRQDQTLDRKSEYGGGQVLSIDKEKMKVTFVAHRGWGPDGKTVYYILTDTTPVGSANTLGIVESTALAHSLTSVAVKDIYEFKNGIKGSGSLGFQPAILSRTLEDDRYTPLSRIKLVEWKKPDDSFLVTNIDDLSFFKNKDKIIVELARPMGANHVINAPQVKLNE